MTNSANGHADRDVDGVQLAVITNRLQAIVRRMTNTLYRTARSGVISVARDFSCCIVTRDDELLVAAESLPIHVMVGPDLICRYMKSVVPELKAGDAFLHNSPYDGNSHAADHCLIVPVVHDGEHRFTVVVKAHMADCGNSLPATVMPGARDVYEEGALIFPCVRVHENYEERDDVIRMCERRLRVAPAWRGDFMGIVGAARIGERGLLELGEELGWDLLERYVDRYFEYSEGKMVDAIRRLNSGQARGRTKHDGFRGPDGAIPVQADVAVDAEDARITVDLRDNIDCLPSGLNLSEACARTAALIGVFMSIEGDVPPNGGSFRRVTVHLRENCAVGIPRFPVSCSAATTNLADRAASVVAMAIAEIDDRFGMAEAGVPNPASTAFISGRDPRRGDADFVNLLLAGFSGGPGAPRADGWLTVFHPGASGMLLRDSTEADELLYPIYIWVDEIEPDTEGAGRQRGTPSVRFEWGPSLGTSIEALWSADGTDQPPQGTSGGLPGGATMQFVRREDGSLERLGAVNQLTLAPQERLLSLSPGGGGFGNPKDRAPEHVLRDVREGWVSPARAREIYGVSVPADVEALAAHAAAGVMEPLPPKSV